MSHKMPVPEYPSLGAWLRRHQDSLTVVGFLLWWVLALIYLRGWEQPVILDRSFHLYSSQEIARGRIPYVDFFSAPPPMAFALVALPMWAFPTLRSGVGPAHTHLVWTLIWTMTATGALYYLAKRLTGRWLGGILGGFIFVGLTPLIIRHAVVGQTRLLAVCAIVVATTCMQGDRWFWAGFATAVGTLAYYPAALVVGGALVLFVTEHGRQRWRRLQNFILGFALPTVLLAGWLAGRGTLVPWFDMTLKWPIAYAISSIGQMASGRGSSFGLNLLHVAKAFSDKYRFVGGWLPGAAAVSYLYFLTVALARFARRVSTRRDKRMLPVFAVSVATASYVLVEKGGPDIMLSSPFVALWLACGVVSLIGTSASLRAIPRWFIVVLLVAPLVAVSRHVLSEEHQLFQLSGIRRGVQKPLDPKLEVQMRATDALWTYLPPDRRTLVMGELWPLVIGGRENISSFYTAGTKDRLAAELANRVNVSVFPDVLEAKPDVVLFSEYRGKSSYYELADLLSGDGYVCTGIADHLISFIRPDDAQALAATVAMQQALSEDVLPSRESLSPAEIASLSNIQAVEIAPGMLLVSQELRQEGQTAELTLYWWTWLPRSQQTAIRLEATYDGVVLASWQGVYPPLPPNGLTIRHTTLTELTALPKGATLRLVAAEAGPIGKHPCKISDLGSPEPVILGTVVAQ